MTHRKRKGPEKSEQSSKLEQSDSPTVFRRRNLIAAGVAAILGGTALTFLREREDSEAERFLREFPDAIPGVSPGGIKTYPVDGAHTCLVHIRNTHGTEYMIDQRFQPIISEFPITSQIVFHRVLQGESLDDVDYPWLDEETKAWMKQFLETEAMRKVIEIRRSLSEATNSEENQNIEKIVSYLGEEYGIHYLYLEELNDGLAPVVNNYAEYRSMAEEKIRRISDELTVSGISPQHKDVLQQELWTQQAALEMLEMSTQDTLDALFPLVVDGRLEIRGAQGTEGEELVEEIAQNIERGVPFDNPAQQHIVFEQRERAVLEMPCSEAIMPIRFGGEHEWWDTIQEWNKDHPDNTYSLIEITPDGYEEGE